MKINARFDSVAGEFDTESGKLVCVSKKKYNEITLCFECNWNIPFAEIKLYSGNRMIDAHAVFDDAVKLGEEICLRWNEFNKGESNENKTSSR